MLKPESFVALVNSALIYRLDIYQAQLAAKALRTAKHHIRQANDKKQLFIILQGLATVSAITRSNELKDSLAAEEAMLIGLIAAASHSDLTEWCEFVGKWITELAFQPLERGEMEKILIFTKQLCKIVPRLWRTCGRAEAALNAVINSK